MTNPELNEFGERICLRKGGGAKRYLTAGSIGESKAILRNYKLELDLTEKKKGIEAERWQRRKTLEQRQRSLRTKVLQRTVKDWLQDLHGKTEVQVAGTKLKVLWTDELGRESELSSSKFSTDDQANSTAAAHKRRRIKFNLASSLSEDARPRAISHESYFVDDPDQYKSKGRTKITELRTNSSPTLHSTQYQKAPHTHNRQLKRQLMVPKLPPILASSYGGSPDAVVKEIDRALSGRAHGTTLITPAKSVSIENEPDDDYVLGAPAYRRVSRLRSVTVSQTEGIRQKFAQRGPQLDDGQERPKSQTLAMRRCDSETDLRLASEDNEKKLHRLRVGSFSDQHDHYDFDKRVEEISLSMKKL